MTWENHGVARVGLTTWQVDHIVPLASATSSEKMIQLCHYTNLQPLWWWDNLEKRDKVP